MHSLVSPIPPPRWALRFDRSNRGIALIHVLILLVVIGGLGVLAVKTTVWGQKLVGSRKGKIEIDFPARAALEIVQMRMTQRMNPPATRANGDPWVLDDNSNDGEDRRKLLNLSTVSDTDLRCGESPPRCYCSPSGDCYHGYRFQTANDVDAQLALYVGDFIWEARNQVGIFEPCNDTLGNCDKSKEWSVAFEGSSTNATISDPFNSSLRIPSPSFDLRGDSDDDEIYRLPLKATAIDQTTGRRTVIKADILLVAANPSLDVKFPLHANVVSRMNLFSGYIRGSVAQFLIPDLLPVDAGGTPLDPAEYFGFGEMGTLHHTCKSFAGARRNPCAGLFASADYIADHENREYFTNMRIDGVISNFGLGANLDPQIYPGSPSPSNPNEGLIIDDNQASTGDAGSNPEDALTNQDPLAIDPAIETIIGRDNYGGIPTDIPYVTALAKSLNKGGTATLATDGGVGCSPNALGLDNGSAGVFISDYKVGGSATENTGTWDPAVIPDNVAPDSMVLAPAANCNIAVNGTYVVRGDVIIAGDGAGQFNGTGTIFATGNIYILNNVNAAGMPANYNNPADDLTFSADGAANFAQISLVCGGHCVIGNLANSPNFAHAMTYTNSEIGYFDLDLTEDKQMDFVVPDGRRPTEGNPRPPSGAFQVKHHDCAWSVTQFTGFGADWTCDSHAPGLLPEGSDLVTAKHIFAFTEDTGLDEQAGYGYVRNSADPTSTTTYTDCDGALPNPPCYATPGRKQVTYNVYESDLPIDTTASGDPTPDPNDLFRNGWVSTSEFRNLAGAQIRDGTDPDQRYHQHDSYDPNYINRTRVIAAKIYAGGVIVGLASFDDKYNFMVGAANPDDPRRAQGNYLATNSRRWSVHLFKDVNDTSRYGRRCTTPLPIGGITHQIDNGSLTGPTANIPFAQGIDILGGLFARYVNVLSTNGLCIYRDDRPAALRHERIYVIPGSGYQEDPEG